jgi:muramidase (phage lysozyme)
MNALTAFLSLIAWSEGTSASPLTKNNGYDVIVGGLDGPSVFTDYSDHPFAPQFGRAPVQWQLEPPEYSTASGRYQLLYRWWEPYKAQLGLKDFSPQSQDAVALQQMKEHGAVALVMAGDIQGAVAACHNVWASFPGNAYGQAGGHDMATLLAKYAELTG